MARWYAEVDAERKNHPRIFFDGEEFNPDWYKRDAVYRDFADDPDMEEIVRRYKLAEVDDYGDSVRSGMSGAQKQEAAEELTARIGEESLKPEAERAPWYERAVAKLREIIRRYFPGLQITRREIETLAPGSRVSAPSRQGAAQHRRRRRNAICR